MSWIQYEVWAENEGHQELIETSNSKKEALSLGQKLFNDGADKVQVFEENSDGDYKMVTEFK